jgi:hypothetical protein
VEERISVARVAVLRHIQLLAVAEYELRAREPMKDKQIVVT